MNGSLSTTKAFLTEEQLTQLSEYASLYLPISDIAVLLTCDHDQLKNSIATIGTPEYIAYRKGKLETKVKLHEQERKLAFTGSPLAIENMQRNLQDMEDDE